jgi:predicted Zn-dependent protease
MAGADRDALERRVETLRRLLERDPDDALAWYGLGRALLELARPGEATPAFRRALDAKPDYTAAWRELGRALLAEGEPAAALAALREGIALAARTGDLQTGREMETFARRAERALAAG